MVGTCSGVMPHSSYTPNRRLCIVASSTQLGGGTRAVVVAAIAPAGKPRPKPLANTYTQPNKPVSQPPIESTQFRSDDFVTILTDNSLTGSMGRVGTCADNGATQSWFGFLQTTYWTATTGPPGPNSAPKSYGGSKQSTTTSDANAA